MHPSSAQKAAPDPVVLSSDDEEEITQNDKQIVLYDPTSAGPEPEPEPEPGPKPIQCRPPPLTQFSAPPRVLPSVGAFTVQCAQCFKWRLIPSKEKYEVIREHILEQPFSCDVAKEWRPEISCDEPADIEQDGSRLWAIDKPSIAQPPPGWERELRIRGEGSSKFADVYYIAPTGKRLRSMVDVQKYLLQHPEFITQGVTLSQFSFQIPKPLQENYVRKRAARLPGPVDEPTEVRPLSWAPPDDPTALQLAGPGFSTSYSRNPTLSVNTMPMKKKARPSMKHMYDGGNLHNSHRFKVKGPLPPDGVYDL